MQYVPFRPVAARGVRLLASVALLVSVGACSAYNPDLVQPPDESDDTKDGGMANAGSHAMAGSGGVGGEGGAGGQGGMGGTGGTTPGCRPNPNTKNQVCTEICPETCNNKDDDCDLHIDEGEADDNCHLENAVSVCDQGKCVIASCTGTFRDCDEKAKNGCETVENDPDHCGVCGKKCSFEHGIAACVDGECVRAGCESGYGDCDKNASDCETQLNTQDNCGGCKIPCTEVDNATASCAKGYCGPGVCEPLWGDCNEAPGDGCEKELKVNSDCGACHHACTLPGATTECSTGECKATSCNVGYDDCDLNPDDGCESLSSSAYCGSCDTPCDTTLPNVTSATHCDMMACTVVCKQGYGDCDDDPSNGCETTLDSPTNCGECHKACDLPNANESCSTGTCTFAGCDQSHLDCGGASQTDCETNKNMDNAHCGSCDVSCDTANTGRVCSGGVCSAVDCSMDPHKTECGATLCGNCNTSNDGDCETPIDTVTNCGACGNACAFTNPTQANPTATLACAAGGCKAVCKQGFGDCNGDYRDGCETPLNTTSNCDACGVACAISNSAAKCTTFSAGHYLCEIGDCATDFGDCDMDKKTCESPLNTPAHCGTCLKSCSFPNAVEACTGGTGAWDCSVTGCDQPYYKNCDNMRDNGCEVDSRSNVANCGSCMNDCRTHAHVASAGTSCVNSLCDYACSSGYADCDGMMPGCETDTHTNGNCGGCGVTCSRSNASASCSTGTCTMVPNSCVSGFANCNGQDGDGCETALKTVTDCTGCGNVCSVGNGVGTCSTGSCVRASCNSGWDDCDANALDCERDVRSVMMGGLGPCLPDASCTKKSYTDPTGPHDYYFCTGALSWTDARAKCQLQKSGDLVRIDDANENAFVLANVSGADAWIGATDAAVEGAWRWIDNTNQFWNGAAGGTVVGGLYNKWNGGEPNDSGANEDCGMILKNTGASNGFWNDAACTATSRYVCETQADLCPADPNKVSPGQCGCGNLDTDTDNDLTADCNDLCDNDAAKVAPGACGCGMSDADGDGDGTPNCNDACPTDPAKIAQGTCGCGVADTDSDSDGTPNCNDACPNDPMKQAAPCGFSYTPSNFSPSGLAFNANVTVNCNATVTSSTSTAAITICGTAVTPSVLDQTTTGGPKVYVLPMASLTVTQGFTLKLNGTLPVVLAVAGTATINGTIDAGSVGSATVGAGGNVSCSAGNGKDGTVGSSNFVTGGGTGAGGGGAGFGLGGGKGGAGNSTGGTGGAAGAAEGALTPLRGGCHGGAGGGTGTGGHGGGAFQLSASTVTVSSTAIIASAGGGGVKGASSSKGGSGGGSGGAILLEGSTLSINSSAWITANGGGGGSSANPGSDGQKNNTAQTPGGPGGGTAGGKGGAAAGAATSASDINGFYNGSNGGSGGGGGVGRIRLHQVTAGCSTASLSRTSPAVGLVCP